MAREKATLRIVDQGIRGYGQACHYDGEALSIKLLGKPDAVMIVPRSSIAILTDLAINRRHMLFAKYPYRYNLRLRSDSFLIS